MIDKLINMEVQMLSAVKFLTDWVSQLHGISKQSNNRIPA